MGFCYFIPSSYFVNRRKVYVKFVEKMTIFWAVKHVLMRTIPSAYCQYWKVLFLAAGDVPNVYVSFTLLVKD